MFYHVVYCCDICFSALLWRVFSTYVLLHRCLVYSLQTICTPILCEPPVLSTSLEMSSHKHTAPRKNDFFISADGHAANEGTIILSNIYGLNALSLTALHIIIIIVVQHQVVHLFYSKKHARVTAVLQKVVRKFWI